MRKQKNTITGFTYLTFVISFAIFISSTAFAGGYTQLPRNLGQFEIGMSKAAFIKLTKTVPESCPVCIDNEFFATLNADLLKKLDAGDTGGDGADFFFYNDKLYHIAAGSSIKDLFLAREEYEQKFGGPGREKKQSGGSSSLVWEETGTLITINYRTDDQEVFSVNYYDWNLKEERDWRESIASEQTAIFN